MRAIIKQNFQSEENKGVFWKTNSGRMEDIRWRLWRAFLRLDNRLCGESRICSRDMGSNALCHHRCAAEGNAVEHWQEEEGLVEVEVEGRNSSARRLVVGTDSVWLTGRYIRAYAEAVHITHQAVVVDGCIDKR